MSATWALVGIAELSPRPSTIGYGVLIAVAVMLVVLGVVIAAAGARRGRRDAGPVSLARVLSVRERASLWFMFEQALTDHARSQDSARRMLNSLLREGGHRLVTRVTIGDGELCVEHLDGLVLRLRGVQRAIADRLAVAAARHRVELVFGSTREAIFEVSDSADARTQLHVHAQNIERD